MRLIDADAFIEYIKETSEKLEFDKFHIVDSALTVKDILDGVIADLNGTSRDGFKNAPTVEPERTLESAIDYLQSTGWLQEHDRILTESTESARKKGKWIVHDYDLGRERYECAECKGRCDLEYNFCPNCGTDMRGE